MRKCFYMLDLYYVCSQFTMGFEVFCVTCLKLTCTDFKLYYVYKYRLC